MFYFLIAANYEGRRGSCCDDGRDPFCVISPLFQLLTYLIGCLGCGCADDVAVAVLGRVPARRVRRLGQDGQVRHVAEEGGR